MTQSNVALKSHLFPLINDQIDQIKQKKTLKLNRINANNKFSAADLVEGIYEFLHSYSPPLRLERLSLQGNQITELPANFSVISRNIRFLDLHNNDLSSLSDTIREFVNLEILDLSSNRLWNLPSINVLGGLKSLRVVSLKENNFKYLPPVLGEMANLSLIEVADNPLVLPSIDLIKMYQHQRPDLDWVSELKHYLFNNKALLEFKLHEQGETKIKMNSALPQTPLTQPPVSLPPAINRSKSISETKSKASKAARRMGLIIKKPDDGSDPQSSTSSSSNPVSANTTLNSVDNEINSSYDLNLSSDFSLPLNGPHSASAADTSFNPGTPPILNVTTTASTAPSTQASSPSLLVPNGKPTVPSITTTNSTSTPSSDSGSNMSTLSRPSSRNRSRSNTLKEIDKILEKNDIVDTEHKSSAYFRRLSTLQENPIDETISPHSQFNVSRMYNTNTSPINPQSQSAIEATQPQLLHHEAPQRQHSLSVSYTSSKDDVKSSAVVARSNSISSSEISPSKVSSTTKKYTATTIVKVSRKILFSFSELHSSVRRFTGFCVDKKITIRMVSFLYTTKSNIDSLVENLEIMEETGNNLDQIVASLYTCINSFKSIMGLLSENFGAFVVKIDVCFIRMLYLTLYGSFNEFLNAYRILVPNSKPPSFSMPNNTTTTTSNDSKSKLSINTNVFYDTEDVDEKLYRSIEISTSNAQVVFGELTRAIGKSAIASTTSASTNPGISHAVATKVKELTNVCMTSVDITKRLKTKLITIRNNASQTTKRLFWDDVNLFLKAIIQTFSSVKGIMKDLPILNEVRSSMANLTKTTKDVTILLEVSSYKSMALESSNTGHSNSTNPPSLVSIPSVSNMFTPSTAHPLSQNSLSSANLSQLNNLAPAVRTPLVASLGPAAQAIMPSNHDLNNNFAPVTPNLSPGVVAGHVPHGAPVTAPAQSTGQFFAKNGMNPFDGLIMANRDKDREDHERMNTSFNL